MWAKCSKNLFARYVFDFIPITVKLIHIQARDIGDGDFNFLEEVNLEDVDEKVLRVVSLESKEEQDKLVQEYNEEEGV